MVDKFIRVGQNEDLLGYDDADYRGGIEVDDTIICQDGVEDDEAVTKGQADALYLTPDEVNGTTNQVIVTQDAPSTGEVTLSTPQDIDTEADLILGSLDIDLQSDQVGLEITGDASQTEDLQQWKDSADNILCRINSNGRLYTTAGLSADAIQGGSALILFTHGGVVVDGVYLSAGNYDHTGGTYERVFTDTTNSPFTLSDADKSNWIVIRSGVYTGALAEISQYIDASTVLLYTLGWDFDLTNVDYAVIEHPALVVGDGFINQMQCNTLGHFNIHSHDWVGSDMNTNLMEIDLDADIDTATALEILSEINGYDACRAFRVYSSTGDLVNNARFANIVSNIDVSEAVSSTADEKASAFSSTVTGTSDMEVDAFVVRPGHTTAFKVLGSAAFDPGYGYDVTSGVVTDRVNGTPQAGTAFLESSTANITLFTSTSDYILLGSDSVFEIINVVLGTPSSLSITADFDYSTGNGTWSSFTPEDITASFTQSGPITFDSSDLTGWAKGDEAESSGDITSAYYIRITRTRIGVIPTLPVEFYFSLVESRAAGMLIRGDGIVQHPYITAAPSNLVNGMVWMESDGLHLYYNDSESVVS